MNNILSYYGKKNTPFLHGGGKIASYYLIEKLNCQKNENVLEIGCGTGATLALLAQNYPHTNFFACELSSLMLEKTALRLNLVKTSQSVELKKIKEDFNLPFEKETFHKIYFESVIAFQNKSKIDYLLQEIYRVLKPNGKLIFNETIWCDTTSTEEINHVNAICKKYYGMIQASDVYKYKEDWVKLLHHNHFKVTNTKDLNNLKVDDVRPLKRNSFKSNLFSWRGKLKADKKAKNTIKKASLELKEAFSKKQLMTSYLFENQKEIK